MPRSGIVEVLTSQWSVIMIREGFACMPGWFFTPLFQFTSISSSLRSLVLFPTPKKALVSPHCHKKKKKRYQQMTRRVSFICCFWKGRESFSLKRVKEKTGKRWGLEIEPCYGARSRGTPGPPLASLHDILPNPRSSYGTNIVISQYELEVTAVRLYP